MNILVPRNIDSRIEKLRQNNLKLLQNDTILSGGSDYLSIDQHWNFKSEDVKVKEINGNVIISEDLSYIPEWLKNVRVRGHFVCINNPNIRSLKNSPYMVDRDFDCYLCNLHNLERMPEYIGEFFNPTGNIRVFTKKDIPSYVKKCAFADLTAILSPIRT